MKSNDILKYARETGDASVESRRFLHANPGVGFDVSQAYGYIWNELEKMGYAPRKCGRSGIVAMAGGKKPGKVFLLRADMDALPGDEQSGEEFAAVNGAMHACGHDMHAAMLLGAARILKKCEDEICGQIKLMFQPAEEILEGAKDMISAGVLEDPHVDAAMMIHVMPGVPMKSGTVIVSPAGVTAPAADYFEIRIKGKGCHGAMPDKGIDPLNAAAHVLIALQEINAREIKSTDRAALTIGFLRAGHAPNMIPDKAVMGGSLRAFDEDVREFMKKRIRGISCGIAAAFRAEAEVEFTRSCPSLFNDEKMTADMGIYMKELLGEKGAFTAEDLASSGAQGSSGSEDFAYVSRNVPSVMLAMAAGGPDDGCVYPLHHPGVRFDEEALPIGSAVYSWGAIKWLEEHS